MIWQGWLFFLFGNANAMIFYPNELNIWKTHLTGWWFNQNCASINLGLLIITSMLWSHFDSHSPGWQSFFTVHELITDLKINSISTYNKMLKKLVCIYHWKQIPTHPRVAGKSPISMGNTSTNGGFSNHPLLVQERHMKELVLFLVSVVSQNVFLVPIGVGQALPQF